MKHAPGLQISLEIRSRLSKINRILMLRDADKIAEMFLKEVGNFDLIFKISKKSCRFIIIIRLFLFLASLFVREIFTGLTETGSACRIQVRISCEFKLVTA